MAYLRDYKLENEKLKEDQEYILERGEAFLQVSYEITSVHVIHQSSALIWT